MNASLNRLLLISLLLSVSLANSLFYTACTESATRVCPFGTNVTDKLLSFKKGGSNILSTANYESNFFLCEEYNYDCGYAESISHFVTIANGMQLNLTLTELNNIISGNSALVSKI